MERKNVFITGGSRGIGKAIAKKFAQNGYDVIVNYVSENTNLEELEKEFKNGQEEIRTLFVKGDVTDVASCTEMVEQITKEFGKLDVVINNAGITKDGLLMRMKEEDFDKVLDINLKGTFHICKQVVPIMMKQKHGKIVNISSVVGIAGNAGQSNYAASKAGIIGFTKSLAKELASRNILANCVAPGFIRTDMTDVLADSVKENILSGIPLKRMGTAEEVANLVYFLASDENSYITGQVIPIDGGMIG